MTGPITNSNTFDFFYALKNEEESSLILSKDIPQYLITQIERYIKNVNHQIIQDIAKTFAGAIMIFLEIDTDDGEPIQLNNPAWEGFGTFYTSSSPLFSKLHHALTQSLQIFFSNPNDLIEKGISFSIYSSLDPLNSFFYHIKDQLDLETWQQTENCFQSAIKRLHFSSLEFELKLSINLTRINNLIVTFDMHRIINGHVNTRSNIDLDEFTKYASKEKSF